MSLLIGAEGARTDLYTVVGDVADLSLAEGPILVPLTVIDAVRDIGRDVGRRAGHNERVGLSVANDTAIEAIEPYLGCVDLIAVAFPSFSDGRGFSLAKRLRRAGFAGTLRASGPLIADQFAEALACGFDEVKVPDTMAERQPAEQWMKAKDIVGTHYQNGYGAEESILRQRLAARRTNP